MPGGRVKLTNSPGGSVIKRYVRTDGGGAGSQRGRAVPGALITPSSEETQASGGQIAQLIAQLQAEKKTSRALDRRLTALEGASINLITQLKGKSITATARKGKHTSAFADSDSIFKH